MQMACTVLPRPMSSARRRRPCLDTAKLQANTEGRKTFPTVYSCKAINLNADNLIDIKEPLRYGQREKLEKRKAPGPAPAALKALSKGTYLTPSLWKGMRLQVSAGSTLERSASGTSGDLAAVPPNLAEKAWTMALGSGSTSTAAILLSRSTGDGTRLAQARWLM